MEQSSTTTTNYTSTTDSTVAFFARSDNIDVTTPGTFTTPSSTQPQAQTFLAEIAAFYQTTSTQTVLESGNNKAPTMTPEHKQRVLTRLEAIAWDGANFGTTTQQQGNTVTASPPVSSSGGPQTNTNYDSHLLNLPLELMEIIYEALDNSSRKSLRMTCRAMSNIVPLNISRVYLSANPLNISVLLKLANHPWYSSRVTELVWDDARLVGDVSNARNLLARTPATRLFSDIIEEEEDDEEDYVGQRLAQMVRQRLAMENMDEDSISAIINDMNPSKAAPRPQHQQSSVPSWFRAARLANNTERLLHEEKNELNRLGGVEPYTATHGLQDSNLVRINNYFTGRTGMFHVYRHPGEKIPDMFTTDEHNMQADWDYYTALLEAQHYIEQTGAHIAAFAVALEKMPNLRKFTVAYTAHGRAGARASPPRYETPMIRAFPSGFNYLVPLGWSYDPASEDGRPDTADTQSSTEFPTVRPAGTDALTAILRVLSGRIADTLTQQNSTNKRAMELHVDDSTLGGGIDFQSLEDPIDSDGYVVLDDNDSNDENITTRLAMLAQIIAQPGFDALTLHTRFLTPDQQAAHIESGAFAAMLSRANGGQGLASLDLSFNPNYLLADEDGQMTAPIVSLPHLLTKSNTRRLEHLALSHMRVDEQELLDTLAMISSNSTRPTTTDNNKLKSIKLYNIVLVNRVTPPAVSGGSQAGWASMLERIRDHGEVGQHWASLSPGERPKLRIGAPSLDFLESQMGGRRVWVDESRMAEFLYNTSTSTSTQASNHDNDDDDDDNNESTPKNPLVAPNHSDEDNAFLLSMGVAVVDQVPVVARGAGYTDDVFDGEFRGAHNEVRLRDVEERDYEDMMEEGSQVEDDDYYYG